MSTLSAQCDELRKLAAKYDELKSGATRVVRISLDTGTVLREAADTIDRLDAENSQLRERITTQKQTIQAYRDESREWREVADHAQAESVRLRNAVDYLYGFAKTCGVNADDLRELGVES